MRRLVVSAVLAAGVTVGGCGSDVTTFDSAGYVTVEDLNANADAMVIGTVGDLLATERDNSGEPEIDDEGRAAGIPMAFYEFSVERVVRGQVPATIVVSWLDLGQASNTEELSALSKGQHVVLWLDHLTADDMPGIESFADVWVPLSGDNGVMDIAGDQATARSSVLTGLDSGSRVSDEPLTVDLDSLEATARG